MSASRGMPGAASDCRATSIGASAPGTATNGIASGPDTRDPLGLPLVEDLAAPARVTSEVERDEDAGARAATARPASGTRRAG